MKTKPLMLLVVGGALASGFQAGASDIYLPNLLADPGFESGTPVANVNGIGGWSTIAGAAFSWNYRHSGTWTMACFYEPTYQIGVSFQTVPAAAGVTYNLTAWGLVPDPLSIAPSVATVFVDFLDVNGSTLGVESLLLINGAIPANTWIPLSLTATAPPGTTSLAVVAGLYGAVPRGVVYYDDFSLVAIPEPSSCALLVLAAAARLGICRRR